MTDLSGWVKRDDGKGNAAHVCGGEAALWSCVYDDMPRAGMSMSVIVPEGKGGRGSEGKENAGATLCLIAHRRPL